MVLYFYGVLFTFCFVLFFFFKKNLSLKFKLKNKRQNNQIFFVLLQNTIIEYQIFDP